jgi:hypothetical protein
MAMFLYQPKPFTEPAIKSYAVEMACIDPGDDIADELSH